MTAPKVKVVEIYRAGKTQKIQQNGVTVVRNAGEIVDVTGIDHTQLRRMLNMGILTKELSYVVPDDDDEDSPPPVKHKK